MTEIIFSQKWTVKHVLEYKKRDIFILIVRDLVFILNKKKSHKIIYE